MDSAGATPTTIDVPVLTLAVRVPSPTILRGSLRENSMQGVGTPKSVGAGNWFVTRHRAKGRAMRRIFGGSIGVVLTGVTLLGTFSGIASAAPAGGTLKVWGHASELFRARRNHCADRSDRRCWKDALRHGIRQDEFERELRETSAQEGDHPGEYDAAQRGARPGLRQSPPADYNTTTCSGSIVTNGPVTVVSGTKAYTGVTGSLNLTAALPPSSCRPQRAAHATWAVAPTSRANGCRSPAQAVWPSRPAPKGACTRSRRLVVRSSRGRPRHIDLAQASAASISEGPGSA